MQIRLPAQTLALLQSHGKPGTLVAPRTTLDFRKNLVEGPVAAKVLAGAQQDPARIEQLSPELQKMVLTSAVKSPASPLQQQESSVIEKRKRAWLARQAENQERFRRLRLQNLPILTKHLRNQVKGPGTREDGIALARTFHAQPGAFFLSREYNARNLEFYVGASNALRSMGLENKAYWGIGGWHLGREGVGENAYTQGLHSLRAWMEKENIREDGLREALQDRKRWTEVHGRETEKQMIEVLWSSALAADGVGDLDFGRGHAPFREPEWAEFQGLALPMRLFTSEQVGMAFPQLTQQAVDRAVHRWARKNFVKALTHSNPPNRDLAGLRIWQVTEKAVQAGIEAGLMTPSEGRSRLVVRRTQEAHDLAVGDTLLLLSVQALEMGIKIESVETETALGMSQTLGMGQAAGMVPDLRLRLDMGPARIHQVVNVEVVGRGGTYRSNQKLSGAVGAGMKMFSAGLDGCGVRHG